MPAKWWKLRLRVAVWSAALFLLQSAVPVAAVRKTRLTWVNGIAYTLQHMEDSKGQISDLFGGKPVLYCHNPTAMAHDEDMFGYLGDLTQAGTQKLGRITTEVNSLVRHLKEAVASVGRQGRVVHIAHSQGALLTSLAARQLSPLEMSQIEVITFGGAAAIRKTPQTPFSRCVNYYAVNDPLLFVVPQAAHALRSGFVENDEFCFLAPRVGDPIQDHNLLGPTYVSALAWEGQRFQRQYQNIMYRTVRPMCVVLLVLFEALSQKLEDGLKAVLRVTLVPLLRAILLLWKWMQTKSEQIRMFLIANVFRPLVILSLALFELIREGIRTMRGEEKYLPVDSIVSYDGQ